MYTGDVSVGWIIGIYCSTMYGHHPSIFPSDICQVQQFRAGGSDIRETLRIFPMTLRVVAYEDPPPPPPVTNSDSPKGKGKARETDAQFEDPATSLIYKLPIIHIEGEARGSDMDEMVIRKVQGTVRMIGDGAVRWSLVGLLLLVSITV